MPTPNSIVIDSLFSHKSGSQRKSSDQPEKSQLSLVMDGRELVVPSIEKVLVVGHGNLATRQRPIHEHWLARGVEVHCADTEERSLEDCVTGSIPWILPRQEKEMLAAGPWNLVLVNNVPQEHLSTATFLGSHGDLILIQKPQDLNYPLIETVATSKSLQGMVHRSFIHDHYRNKDVVAALLTELPKQIARNGFITKVMFFLTEGRNVNSEQSRFGSL
jgi:hypothetical protein